MRSFHTWLLTCSLTTVLLLSAARPATADLIDLDDLALPPGSFNNQGTTFVGIDPFDPNVRHNTFTSHGAVFNNNFNTRFQSWSGWSYSNVQNVTTPGLGNQYAAYNVPGGGAADSPANYAVGFPDTFTPDGVPTIDLPSGMKPLSARITNATYPALSMLLGDSFARKFGVGPLGEPDFPDFFLLTIRGFDASNAPAGTVDFYLADYRFANSSQDYIVDRWTTVDLSALGAATARLTFGLTSSDNHPVFGMNTPAYFALDNLLVQPQVPTAVPEPATFALAGIGAATLLLLRLRRRGPPAADPR